MSKRMGLARMEALMEKLKREINLSHSTSFKGEKRRVESINNTAVRTRTLTKEESGTLFLITNTTADNNITFTFPTAATAIAGVHYEFTFSANCDDNADVIWTTGANGIDIYGYIVTGGANSTLQDCDGLSKITLDASVAQSTEGTRLVFMCDGSNWHMTGYTTTVIGSTLFVESASA